jgi:hypothetical protein
MSFTRAVVEEERREFRNAHRRGDPNSMGRQVTEWERHPPGIGMGDHNQLDSGRLARVVVGYVRDELVHFWIEIQVVAKNSDHG